MEARKNDSGIWNIFSLHQTFILYFGFAGYVQIVDGYTREANISNRENPGFYCGEIDSPKTFISETPYVKVVFHADEYGPDTFMQFEATVKQQQEVASR